MADQKKEHLVPLATLIICIAVTFITTVVLSVVTAVLVYPLSKDMLALQAEMKSLQGTFAEEMAQREIYLKILILKSDIDRKLAKKIAVSIHNHSAHHNIDPDLVIALGRAESYYEPKDVSGAGAIGLLQVMPSWVKVYEDPCDLKRVDCNVRSGVRLLRSYLDHYNGDMEKALLVYNRGTNPVDIALSRGYDPGNGYVESIQKFYNQLKEME